jgi:predicted homoserine dehydrogenase-like protein
MGLSDGCRLVNAVAKDQLIRKADVEPPEGRLAHRLRTEQDAHFGAT